MPASLRSDYLIHHPWQGGKIIIAPRGYFHRFTQWLDKGRIRFTAGPRLIQKHKERVVAKDAWLTHQKGEHSKLIKLFEDTNKLEQMKIDYDPLAPLCAEYALKGWDSVKEKAQQKGLSEEVLAKEACKRGHKKSLD